MFNLLKYRTSIFWIGLGLLILCLFVYILNFSYPIDKAFNNYFINLKQSSLPEEISDIVIIEIEKKELVKGELWPWGKEWFPYFANLLDSYDPKGILFLFPSEYKKKLNNGKKLPSGPTVKTFNAKKLIVRENDFLKIRMLKSKNENIELSSFSKLICFHYNCENKIKKEYTSHHFGFPFSTFPIKEGKLLISLVSPSKIPHLNYFNFLVNVRGLNSAGNSYDFSEKFKNKIIIFADSKESFSTLLGNMSLGEVFASATYTALNSNFIRRGAIFSVPFILFTGILLFILLTKFNLVGRTTTWLSSVCLIFFICFYLYDLFGILISPFAPILFSTLFYFNVNIFQFVKHRDNKLKKKRKDLAHEIKKEIISSQTPMIKGGTLSCNMIHSKLVGGDFYNTFQFKDKLTIFFGTVSGKSLKGVRQIEDVNNKLKLYYEENTLLPSLCGKLNQDFRNRACSGEIIKLLAVEIHSLEGIVKFVNTGQVPPFISTSTSSHLKCGKPADPTPLGMYENREFNEQVVRLEKKDIFIILSEGMYELSHFTSNEVALDFEKIFSNSQKSLSYFSDEIISRVKKILENKLNSKDRTLIIFKKNGKLC